MSEEGWSGLGTGQRAGMCEMEGELAAGLEGVKEGGDDDDEDDQEEVEVEGEVEALELTEAQVEAVCGFSFLVFVRWLDGGGARLLGFMGFVLFSCEERRFFPDN